MTEVLLQEERLCLLPGRAVWWPAQRTLILSDLHWGKSAHFRKHGIPMPGGTQHDDAMRLSALVRAFGAERMIVAGDFFHSRHNSEVADFGRWRAAHASLIIDFVLGNHDILPAAAYDAWNLQVHRECLSAGPFLIAHDAVPDAAAFVIHGHIHPGVRLRGLGRQAFTLPAYCVSERSMILPAFGRFTGCKLVPTEDYRAVYVIGEGKVMQWK